MTEKYVERLAAASDSHAALQAAANSLPNASRQIATNHIQYRCGALKRMKTLNILFYLIGLLIFSSCSKTDEEKLDTILNSDELIIQRNIYGGIAGYSEQIFKLKKGEYESLLIIDEGTDYQTFVRMDEKKELLKSFITDAYESNNPNKEMSNSCVTGIDSDYILKSGWTTLKLRPDEKCDSIFNLIVYD